MVCMPGILRGQKKALGAPRSQLTWRNKGEAATGLDKGRQQAAGVVFKEKRAKSGLG